MKEKKTISHYFKVQRTERYLRLKLLNLNIYFSIGTLRTRKRGEYRRQRTAIKRRLVAERKCCEHCGKPLDFGNASVHHVIPVSVDKSKQLDYDNLQLLCTECHARLHEIEQLRAKVERVSNKTASIAL